MTKREVVRTVLEGKKPPYVPWSFGFTHEANDKLCQHLGSDALHGLLQNHLLNLGSGIGYFEDIGNDHVRDVYGVVWDRSDVRWWRLCDETEDAFARRIRQSPPCCANYAPPA